MSDSRKQDATPPEASRTHHGGSEEISLQKGLPRIGRRKYEKKLAELQVELVKLQEWIKTRRHRVMYKDASKID